MFRMKETRNEEQRRPEAEATPEVWASALFIPLIGGGLLECDDGRFTLTFTGNSVSGTHLSMTPDATGSLHGPADRRVILLEEGGGHTYRGLLVLGTPDRFIGRRIGAFSGTCSARAIKGNAVDQAEAIWVATKGG
jgi:hypothetical protein